MKSVKRRFFWELWNTQHIAKHNVKPEETEFVVRHAKSPYPRAGADGKFFVWGQTPAGRYLQVIFSYREDAEIDFESLKLDDVIELERDGIPFIYVLHARELTASEKSRLRRSR